MDDDGLIARMAAGDGTALKELFSEHAPWLAARLRAALPASEVQDVLQETFLAAWRAAPRYRPEGKAGAWLWGIARRQAALWLRRRGSAASLVSALERTAALVTADATDAALSRVELDSAVGALGRPEREVWTLLCVEDRSVAQVAQLMGIPVGTVKSRAHRARRLLRTALGGRLVIEGGPL
jgi:RNA polymerase sigma-70 factor (ECF subfamily)